MFKQSLRVVALLFVLALPYAAFAACSYNVYERYSYRHVGELALEAEFVKQYCSSRDTEYWYYEIFNKTYTKAEVTFTVYFENGDNFDDTRILYPRQKKDYKCEKCNFEDDGQRVSGFKVKEFTVLGE